MISIRRMNAQDMPAARFLLSQLGYVLGSEEIRRRYDKVTSSQDHALMVGKRGGALVALCHVFARPALDKPPEAVVQALVVDQACRGEGVGRIMMAAAESWARDRGFMSVALASDIGRSAAHTFYKRLGYQRIASSTLFRKDLNGEAK